MPILMNQLITTVDAGSRSPRDAANYFAKTFFETERYVESFNPQDDTFKLVDGLATYKVVFVSAKVETFTPAMFEIRKISLPDRM